MKRELTISEVRDLQECLRLLNGVAAGHDGSCQCVACAAWWSFGADRLALDTQEARDVPTGNMRLVTE